MKSTSTFENHRLEKRFRAANLVVFIVLSVVMVAVMISMVRGITQEVSNDYARFYSTRAIGTLNTHLNREIALVNKAVRSEAIVDWFEDEFDEEKRRLAYREMMGYIDVLYSANLYFGIEGSMNEFSVQADTSYEEFVPYDVLDEDRYADQWYFECIASENDYTFNVDIDKLKERKLVWLNHKVVSDSGEILGVFCSGLKFDRVIEELFDEYDNKSVWGLVIDEHGIVQMDSSLQTTEERLIFDNDRHISGYYDDPVFAEAIQQHLDGIDGFFGQVMNPEVYTLDRGAYSYFSIAPIEATNWSVITFYNAGSLFDISELLPLFFVMLLFFVVYLLTSSLLGHQTIFLPFHKMVDSLSRGGEDIYGLERRDEIGELARTIKDMKESLDTYNAELVKAIEEAERASKAKGDFLANMSHEMRTPLNTVIGMAQIARRTDDVERIHDSICKIENASNHLLGVINDVLDMSKIEAGKLTLEKTAFDFAAMMRKTADVLMMQMQQKEQNFTLEIDEDIPVVVVSDELRLAQVIANLLSNAVKFTPPKGNIGLSARLLQREGDICRLEVQVRDDGIGISPEQQARLFQSFEQADGGTSRKYGGTGLGLTISKRLVEMLEGTVLIESAPGEGSCFSFTVPVEAGEAPDDGAPEAVLETPGFEGRRLLVVEDIEINREVLAALLEETGVEMTYAENGQEAVELLRQDPDGYDLVFMDLQMPVMDGYEAARQIRAIGHAGAREVPIIAMTANVFSDDIDRCFVAGMNGHLGKPIDYDEVIGVMARYLAGDGGEEGNENKG